MLKTECKWNYQGLIPVILCFVKVRLRRIEKGEVAAFCGLTQLYIRAGFIKN